MRNSGRVVEFDNSRFEPTIGFVLRDLVRDCLDQVWFPWLKGPPIIETTLNSETVDAPTRKAKPTWATKKKNSNVSTPEQQISQDPRSNGARIIIFCIGGVTHSEMLKVKKIADETNRSLMIGSTHIWLPDQFMESLKYLNKKGTRGKAFSDYKRPPYRPPQNNERRSPIMSPKSRKSPPESARSRVSSARVTKTGPETEAQRLTKTLQKLNVGEKEKKGWFKSPF
jgi:syntaxin-binding protein 1